MEIEYYMKNIAYYILDKCGQMSTFRLHKLLYVCQAWYMAWNNGCPLFYEDFEAWIKQRFSCTNKLVLPPTPKSKSRRKS